ncbi:MAG: restriction endonuclease subunit S [Acidobacteriota bacterium]
MTVTFLPMEAIGEDGRLDLSHQRLLKNVLNGYTYLSEGDVCIAKITPCFENGKGAVISGAKNGIAFATTEVIAFRCKRSADARFVYYLLISSPFKPDAEASMHGAGGQKRVSDRFAANYPALLPPPAERLSIAKFLDYETAKIEALIGKQQQLIALLEEKRQAVISNAVTKGLNPDVPMRDSGVEWLGEVPAHWQIVRSKRHFPESYRRADPNDEQLTASQEWGVILQEDFVRRAGRRVVQINQHLERRKRVERDNFVISMRSFQGGLERAWVSGGIRSSYVVLKASAEVEVGYFERLFKSGQYIQALQATANFIRDGQDLNYQNFCLVDLPLPSKEEQASIALFLDDETAKVSSLIEKSSLCVNLLQERRTALISAAVTGKIDVRGWKPPEPQNDWEVA